MTNALTIDVEDYFQVAAFRRQIAVESWDSYPLRVVNNTERVLDWLDAMAVKATFFVLGWVAERVPSLVRLILARGHEIASHGYGHQLIYEIGPEAFRADVRRGKSILEDAAGTAVHGYRAPSYSITPASLWALDILVEEGFSYDSSIFPIVHDLYGMPGAERFPHRIRRPAGELVEFPISTLHLGVRSWRWALPVGGGGYLRLFPVALLQRAFNHINHVEGKPAVLYFHPWEIDPDQPRIAAEWKSRFRHYLNLDKTLDKLTVLVRSLSFAPMKDVLAHVD